MEGAFYNGDHGRANWYVIHTHPKQEDRANANLRFLELETFSPKYREVRYNEFNGKPTALIKQLFPGYIFAKFAINDIYHKVRFTRGVHSVVSFENYPCAVEEQVIILIKKRINEDGFVQMYEEPMPGDEVEIKHGSLNGLSGIFVSTLKTSERVLILLNTVSYQASLIIEKERLRKLSECPQKQAGTSYQ